MRFLRLAFQTLLGSRLLCAALALCLAGGFWLTQVHRVFRVASEEVLRARGISPMARQLAMRHLELWSVRNAPKQGRHKARVNNPEWDLMRRSFLVWSLANMILREPAQKTRLLPVMDRIIAQTMRLEKDKGFAYFSMSYIHGASFRVKPARSMFLDGEIALMLGLRRVIQEHPRYRLEMQRRLRLSLARMKQSSVLSGESYPDEAWLFCNTVTLAALKVSDVLDKTDHSAFFRRWIRMARNKLTDKRTGILFSSYNLDGRPKDGPEGSTIWMAAHNLMLIDEAFARDQYRRAKRLLGRTTFGFGYAVEWPRAATGKQDVDSGPIIPFFRVSAGSSGLALIAASSFQDHAWLQALLTTLRFAAFPSRTHHGGLRFAASNEVGDAVLLYALVQGPMWRLLKQSKGLSHHEHPRTLPKYAALTPPTKTHGASSTTNQTPHTLPMHTKRPGVSKRSQPGVSKRPQSGAFKRMRHGASRDQRKKISRPKREPTVGVPCQEHPCPWNEKSPHPQFH